MSFLDYLKEHRGQFIDHRASVPVTQGITAQEAEETLDDPSLIVTGGGGRAPQRRRRRPRPEPRGIRFRHMRPAFAPSPYSDPLPYEEPWERAFR
ncbi:MAG: hypothetical protein KDC46_08255 [Thermoleophilia bacterium]|nr:hypothetical protein [Thermoleophilia bacterium]